MGHSTTPPLPCRGLDALVSKLVAARRRIAAAQAEEAQLLSAAVDLMVEHAERLRERPGHRESSADLPLREIAAELAAAMRLSDRTVQRRMGDAAELLGGYPAVHAPGGRAVWMPAMSPRSSTAATDSPRTSGRATSASRWPLPTGESGTAAEHDEAARRADRPRRRLGAHRATPVRTVRASRRPGRRRQPAPRRSSDPARARDLRPADPHGRRHRRRHGRRGPRAGRPRARWHRRFFWFWRR